MRRLRGFVPCRRDRPAASRGHRRGTLYFLHALHRLVFVRRAPDRRRVEAGGCARGVRAQVRPASRELSAVGPSYSRPRNRLRGARAFGRSPSSSNRRFNNRMHRGIPRIGQSILIAREKALPPWGAGPSEHAGVLAMSLWCLACPCYSGAFERFRTVLLGARAMPGPPVPSRAYDVEMPPCRSA